MRDFKVLLLGDRGEVLCAIPITVPDRHRAIMRAATYSHDLGAADFELLAVLSAEERIFGGAIADRQALLDFARDQGSSDPEGRH